MGIFTELKERRLIQVVFSYLAAGWVFLEVADQFVDRGIIPEIFYFLSLIWFLGGIPAAFLIGWHHGEKGQQRAPRSEVVFLSLLAVALLGMSSFTIIQLTGDPVDLAEIGPDPNRVAVLYFEDRSPDQESQHIANGLTEALISQLRLVPALDVISRNGVQPFQGSDIPRDSVAEILGAGTLVGGSIERTRDRLVVDVQLYDGGSGVPIPDGRVAIEAPAGEDLIQVMESIGEEAARLLRQKLGQDIVIKRRAQTTNATSWTLVQRAEKLRREAAHLAADDHLDAAFERFDQAHELLDAALRADTLWAEPAVLRSEIEYEKSRLTAGDQHVAERHIRQGIEHAQHALDIDPDNAAALGARGTLRYWMYLLNITPDEQEQHRLLEQGRQDLERAVRLDTGLATAHSVLAHLYFNTATTSQGVLASQRAYEADAYLEAADAILWRLYSGNYNLENWTEAERWCRVGADRFARNPEFAYCQLQLMIAPTGRPDVDRAWNLAARVDSLSPPQTREYERLNALLTVGGVLARAGLQDSARAVLDRARRQITHENDIGDDLSWREAHMRLLADQKDQTFELLRQLVLANPDHAFGEGANVGWMWRDLESDPRFDEIRSTSGTH